MSARGAHLILGYQRGAPIRGWRLLNISRQRGGVNSRKVRLRVKALFRVNTVPTVSGNNL